MLADIPRVPGNPWVFVDQKPGTRLSSIDQHCQRLRVRAGLDDIRIHELCHTYASQRLMNGIGLDTVGKSWPDMLTAEE